MPDGPLPPAPMVQGDGNAGRRPRSTRGSIALCLVIVAAAGLGLAVAIGSGHTDSAMLFVGLPTLLAVAITLSPPARSVHGMTFKGLTVAILLSAVVLHEGAICVLFAAPLVYAVGHTVAAIVTHTRKGTYAVVPLALLLGLEGLAPGLRVAPDQAVTVTHTVSAPPAEVARLIATGPDVAVAPRSMLLANMPLPGHVAGSGVDLGDRWAFHFHGDSHGPGGVLITEVTEHTETVAGGHVRFSTVSDTSIVARWLEWTSASLDWQTTGAVTSVTLTVHFTRGLDPSWYFGPVESAMVGAAANYLLDALTLTEQ